MPNALALHTWTLDSTPLDQALGVIRASGWDAVELRRVDFARAAEAGRAPADVIARVKASGLQVACVGVELGWMWADAGEQARLLGVMEEQCRHAAALGCPRLMSPVDRGGGDLARAADSVRRVGDVVARHGLVLALEFNSQCEQVNTLERGRELVARAGHPGVRLLLDTYHLHRSGATPRSIADVAPAEIGYVQYSDVPSSGLAPGQAMPRLAPGRGTVPFREYFAAFAAKGYAGPLSYEAPDADAWKRPPEDVAREALLATRAVLP